MHNFIQIEHLDQGAAWLKDVSAYWRIHIHVLEPEDSEVEDGMALWSVIWQQLCTIVEEYYFRKFVKLQVSDICELCAPQKERFPKFG